MILATMHEEAKDMWKPKKKKTKVKAIVTSREMSMH